MRSSLLLFALLCLSTTTADAGRRAKTRAVIDRVVGGKVVRRTVVTGTLERRPKKPVTLERELAAARKGWSVTEERAPAPSELTLKGRLVEDRHRAQRRGQSIIQLRRPGAAQLTGEEEIRVYAGGRLTRVKRLAKVTEKTLPHEGPPRGERRPVRIGFDEPLVLLSKGPESTWTPAPPMALRYHPADPYAVVLETGAGNEWSFGRDLLAEALESGSSGEGDVRLRAGRRHLDVRLSSPSGVATIRLPRQEVALFLRASHQSVPRGAENDHLDFDGDLRRLLSE